MRILYCEPFEGGSHARFTRALTSGVRADWTVLTMPPRHWKWRMRGSAIWLAGRPETERDHELLFAGSYVPLAELLGLRPNLASIPSVLYFHENQLAYPVQDEHTKERDFHFGFTQLVSAEAATCCLFNSAYNRRSFLDEARALLSRMPDAVPSGWVDRIEAKSRVLGVPLSLPEVQIEEVEDRTRGPVILWNHRWEHDKDPETFFFALDRLASRVPFRVIICGERYRRAPPIFEEARRQLGDRVIHFGYADSEEDYRALLMQSHLAVSTARHEFFGVSVLEAVQYGARPVVPDRLSYLELFPAEYRYQEGALEVVLEDLCRRFIAGEDLRRDRRGLTAPFGPPLLERYASLFDELVY